MELAALWLGVLADHYTTREAIKRGGREGNPLGLSWVTYAKPVCAALLTLYYFLAPEWRSEAAGGALVLGCFYFACAAWNRSRR